MDNRELQIYKKAVKEKYKYHKLWKILAVLFMCLTILFATLYFTSGDLFTETINDKHAEVEINNNGDSNDNDVTINQ